MAQWQTFLQIARPSLGKAVAGLGLVVLAEEFIQPPCPLDDLLGGAIRVVLRMLPSLVLAVCHLVQGHLPGHARLWEGIWQAAGACWAMLQPLVGA